VTSLEEKVQATTRKHHNAIGRHHGFDQARDEQKKRQLQSLEGYLGNKQYRIFGI
jgi:hypothetical protein